MIKLSDYLNYLNSEVIRARKKADEEAIQIAKEYAEHEYLKYFRVPRFSMPSVKLNIPIKINELSSTTKFKFQRDYDSFLSEINEKIRAANKRKNMRISPLEKETVLKNKNIVQVFDKLEKQDFEPVKNLEDNIDKIDLKNMISSLTEIDGFSISNEPSDSEMEEFNVILKDSLKSRFIPVSSILNDIFIDPNTTKEEDKGNIMLNMEVEMIEEGIRIREVKDKDGNIVEEIIFE